MGDEKTCDVDNQVATFDGLTFDKTGTYNYTIHETTVLTDGWTNDADVPVTVTVTRNDETKKLEASVNYGERAYEKDGQVMAHFDDKYTTSVDAGIEVNKKVNGGTDAVAGETFDFTLTNEAGDKVSEAHAKAGETVAFEGVKYTTADAGKTFKYTIHEVGHNENGWTADSDVAVTVTVTQNADRSLKVERTYSRGTNVAEFTNTYATAGEATIQVYKTVNGGTEAKTDETFTFDLYKADADGNALGEKLGGVETKAGEVASFDDVKFDKPGTYYYVVKETGHNDKGWTAASDVKATVTVTDNGDGTMSATVEYSNTAEGAAGFDDTYEAIGTATIDVYKTVNGGTDAKPDEEFTFDLYDGEGTGGEKLASVSTKAGQVAGFDELGYNFNDAGKTFTYTVHETGHDGSGWTAASDVTAKVTVTDNGDGTLGTSVEYSNGSNAAAFDDTYEATGTATIDVTKTVNGGTEAAPNEDFTFELYEGEKAEGEAVDTVSVKAGATASFSELGFNFNDAGKEFTYTVHETGHNTDGWVADSDVKATVKVTDNGDGTLSAEVTYSRGTNAAAFDDKYDTEATATISVSKTVNGGTEAVEGEWFEFELLDEDGNTVEGTQNVKAQAGDTASFSALSYSLADAGKEFKYTVHEVGHNDKGWTADSDVDVTVKVVKNDDLTLSCEVTYGRGTNAAEFTNTYATSGEATVQVYKTVNGGTEAKPGEVFTFELWEADANGELLPQGCVDKVETKAGEVASFGALKLTEPGTWTYVVHETGHDGNGWTAASDVVATVSAIDNGDGTLKTAVEYSNTAEGAAGFDDIYTAAGELEVKVSKTVNGGTYADDHEFEFGLFETDESGAKTGEPIATVKVKAGQTGVLNGVFYDLDNDGQTITYVVSELGELGEGWTRAADQKVTVKVTDNNDGTMSAEVTYEGGALTAAFDNKYEQPKAEEKKRAAAPFTGDTANATFAFVGAAGLALVAASLRRRRNDA